MKKWILPLLILAVSAAGTFALVRSRRPIETQVTNPLAPLVRVVTAERRDVRLDVSAQGTVLPRTETNLVAQVAGEVIATSPAFEVGGIFDRGQILLRLEPRDYQLAVERAGSQIAQAELRLAQERAEAKVAREEWDALGGTETFGEPDPLVLREPQIAQLEAALAAAEAELELARLNLARTEIRAPFDGRLRTRHVAVGTYLVPGAPIAAIHAIDYAEVRLPVNDADLAFLDLPGVGRGGAAGPEVAIYARFAGREHRWQGRVVRSEGELDPRSRMLHLVARVEDPYDRRGGERPPLVVGQFVDAIITGETFEDVFVLPRETLYLDADDGLDRVQVIDGDDRLRLRPVEVLRRDGDSIFVAGGLENGDRVSTSSLDVVVDGMKVRVAPEDDSEIAPAEIRELEGRG